MKPSTSRWLRAVLAVLLLAGVVLLVDWRAIWEVLRSVNAKWVALALAMALTDRLIITYRWEVLLVPLGIDVGFWTLLRVQLAANFAGSFLPSSLGVDALRVAALVRQGVPATPVIASTLVDRFSLAFASLLFGAATLLVLAGTRIPGNVVRPVFIAAIVGAALFSLVLHTGVRRGVLRRVPERFRGTIASIGGAMLSYRHHGGAILSVAVVTLVLLAVRIVFAKALALACGVNVDFLDLLLVIPLLWIMVMLPITIGGIGVQEASYAVLMGLIGVGPAVAVSMSLIEHIVARAASLPGLLFVGDYLVSRSSRQSS